MSLTRVFACTLLTIAASAAAADVNVSVNLRTGDTFLDARLGDIDVGIVGNVDAYVDDVVVHYGAPRVVIQELVVERHYPPADVTLIAGYAQALQMPVTQVADTYARHRGQGWGVIAKELGVKPGSAQFHAMKRSLSGDPWVANGPPGKAKGKSKDQQDDEAGDGSGAGHGKGSGKSKGKGHGKH
jgi:hypothetical protein